MTKIVMSMLAAAGLLASAPALAGYHCDTATVYVNTTNKYVSGSMSATHNSADATAYIACYVYSNGGVPTAYCWARDAAGTYGSCASSNANIVEAVKSVTDGSYVSFAWDDTGACAYVYARAMSCTPAKAH